MLTVVTFMKVSNLQDNFLITFLFTLPSLLAAFAAFYVFKKMHFKSARGKVFLFLALGLSLWAIAEFLWMMAVVFWDIKPFPSFIDYFYLLAYPLLAIGFWLEYRMNQINWTMKKAITLSTLSILLVTMTGYFGVYQAYDAGNAFWENTANILYGLGDVVLSILVLLILAIVIEYKRGRFFLPWLYVFVANLLMIGADVLFSLYFKEYEQGIRLYRYMDFLWAGSYLLFAYGFLRIAWIIEEINQEIKLKSE